MSFLSLNEELLHVQVVHHGQKDYEAPLHLLSGVLHAVEGVWGFHSIKTVPHRTDIQILVDRDF